MASARSDVWKTSIIIEDFDVLDFEVSVGCCIFDGGGFIAIFLLIMEGLIPPSKRSLFSEEPC